MSSSNIYDLDDIIDSPSSVAAERILNSPIIPDINNVLTPSGTYPSNYNRQSSPPQSILFSDILPFHEFIHDLNETNGSSNYLGTTLPNNDNFRTTTVNDYLQGSLITEDEKLRIIAEPREFSRERYFSELDPSKNRSQRYIRTEDSNHDYDYPTIKISSKWCDTTRQLYIQVTSITVKSNDVLQHFIHPYEIDTNEDRVIKCSSNNSLYFPIDPMEFRNGERSFHISRKKMVQSKLKLYGPLRLFGANQLNNQHIHNPQTVKKLIKIYQLWRFQLVFTVVERCNNEFIPNFHTSVYSKISSDAEMNERTINHANQSFIETIKCIPRKCDWQGGEEVVIVMPYPIAHKVYTIAFDFGGGEQRSAVGITPVDRKTLLFRTPVCPIPPRHGNLKTSLVIKENNYTFHPIDFYYIAPATAPPTMNGTCARCQRSMTNGYASNKRRQIYDGDSETDSGDHLVSQMNDLSLGQKNPASQDRMLSDEKHSKVTKYLDALNQLKDAIAIFLRTNDPSRLFRRSRALLSDCNGDSSPLNDAIEHGHAHLALALIEQIIDMKPSHVLLEKRNENGESPLLVATRRNEWQVMKLIIEKRCDLVEVKDKDGNNLLHLLAKMDEDKGAKTIEDIFAILSNTLKVTLVEEKNKSDQTPAKVAQSHGNTECLELLNFPLNTSEIPI